MTISASQSRQRFTTECHKCGGGTGQAKPCDCPVRRESRNCEGLNEVRFVLDILSKCELTEANCASFAVASQRIRAHANRAIAALNKLSQSETGRTIPEGWRLVPVVASHEMQLAGFDAIKDTLRGSYRRHHMGRAWDAMLDAAPLAPNHDGEKP